MCATDDVCNAYKYWPRNCSLVNATGLVGSEASSSIAETVMINANLAAGIVDTHNRHNISDNAL